MNGKDSDKINLGSSPFSHFSSSSNDGGRTIVELNVPWPLPWALKPIAVALLWQLICSCESREQIVPIETQNAFVHEQQQMGQGLAADWPDGHFASKSQYFLAAMGRDLERVRPLPMLILRCPQPEEEDLQSLEQLASNTGVIIDVRVLEVVSYSSEAKMLVSHLLASIGLLNDGLAKILVRAADESGDRELTSLLRDTLVFTDREFKVFNTSCAANIDTRRLEPIFDFLRHTNWDEELPEWDGLGLPNLLRELWTNPHSYLDSMLMRFKHKSSVLPNKLSIEISVSRHLLRCFQDDTLFIKLDLLDALLSIRRKHYARALRLLGKHTGTSSLDKNVWLAAHVYGQAGLAAAKLGKAQESLLLYRQNLSLLDEAFKDDHKAKTRARAQLGHKLGQLLREHPELPGGRDQAKRYLEDSLAAHQELGMTKGVSMCLSELALLALDQNDYIEAYKQLELALQKDRTAKNLEGQAAVLHQLAKAYERAGELEKALSAVEECQRLHSGMQVSEATRHQVKNTRDRLEHLLGIGREGTLEELLEQLNTTSLSDDRAFGTWLGQKGRTLREIGRSKDAEVLYQEALKKPLLKETQFHITLALAALMLDERRHKEVEELINPLVPVNEESHIEISFLRARLKMQNGQHDESEEIVAPLLKHSSPKVQARCHAILGRIHFQQEHFNQAVAELTVARELSKDAPVPSLMIEFLLSRALNSMGRYEEATEISREMAKKAQQRGSKMQYVKSLIVLGDSLLHLGHSEGAAEEYEKAIALAREINSSSSGPLRSSMHRRAAQAWLRGGKNPAALFHAREAVRHLSNEDVTIEHQGWVYYVASYVTRCAGDQAESDQLLELAEKCANEGSDETLDNAVQLLRYGDLRDDAWTQDEFQWEDVLNPRTVIGRARRLRKQKKSYEALSLLDSMDTDVLNPMVWREAMELRLGILLDLKDWGHEVDAESILKQIEDTCSPEDPSPKILLLKARYCLLNHAYEESKNLSTRAYEKAANMEDFISLSRAAAILTNALNETGCSNEAVQLLRGLADYMWKHGRHQLAVDAHYSLCRHLIEMRQLNEATQELRNLEERSGTLSLSDWVRMQVAYAEIDRIGGKKESSILRINSVLDRIGAENRPDLNHEPLRILQAMNLDGGNSAEIMRASLPIEDRSINMLLSSAKAKRIAGRHSEAIVDAQQALEKAGSERTRTRAMALQELALSLYQGRHFEEAEIRCRAALELHECLNMTKGIPIARVTLARILLKRGKADEAKELLSRAIEENRAMQDRKGESICQRLLNSFFPKGDWEFGTKARDILTGAFSQRRAGLREAAVKKFRSALERAREEKDSFVEATALGAWGIDCFHQGQMEEAESYLKPSVELHKTLGSSHLVDASIYLARVYSGFGRIDEAQTVLEEALSKTTASAMREKLKIQLDRIRKKRN